MFFIFKKGIKINKQKLCHQWPPSALIKHYTLYTENSGKKLFLSPYPVFVPSMLSYCTIKNGLGIQSIQDLYIFFFCRIRWYFRYWKIRIYIDYQDLFNDDVIRLLNGENMLMEGAGFVCLPRIQYTLSIPSLLLPENSTCATYTILTLFGMKI